MECVKSLLIDRRITSRKIKTMYDIKWTMFENQQMISQRHKLNNHRNHSFLPEDSVCPDAPAAIAKSGLSKY